MELRNYQKGALREVAKQLKEGISRQLIVLPTGTGKTILIAAISRRFRRKTLILAHREELIQQAKEKILSYWPKADIGICKANKNELEHKIVIGSVQTCFKPKRLNQLKKKGFGVLIIDEAHHAPASSYLKVIKELGFLSCSKKLLVGLTATPERNDRLSLSKIFQKIVFVRSISEMISSGFLSAVVGRKITTDVSLENVKSYNGDFVIKDLAKAINIPERNKLIASKYKQHAHSRKGIAFCVNVQHCHDLAATFCSNGITAKAVWGEMPMENRRAALAELRNGKTQVLTSCGILTEGFDESSIECIVMARSTKSKSLYIQCVGRGLRPYPQKESCLVLDFADSYHNLKAIMSLDATIPGAEAIDENSSKKTEFKSQVEAVPLDTDVIEISDEEFDILGQNRFIWIALSGNEYSLMDDDSNEIVIHPTANGFTINFYPKNGSLRTLTTTTTLKGCFQFCENFAGSNLEMKFGDLEGPWLQMATNQPATYGQEKILFQHGLLKARISKAHAAIEVRRIVAENNQRRRLCDDSESITEKQKNFLERANVSVLNLNKKEAQQKISQIIRTEQAKSCYRSN